MRYQVTPETGEPYTIDADGFDSFPQGVVFFTSLRRQSRARGADKGDMVDVRTYIVYLRASEVREVRCLD